MEVMYSVICTVFQYNSWQVMW